MNKRTKSLDNAKLVQVNPGLFVEAGGEHGLALTDAQREEVVHKLAVAGPFRERTEQLVMTILQQQAAFLEAVVTSLSPADAARFNVVFDGSRCAIRLAETVLAIFSYPIPRDYIHAVEITITLLREEALREDAVRLASSN